MWKAIGEWFGAILVTAAMAVSIVGAAEWVQKRNAVVPVTADSAPHTIVVDAGHGGADGGATGVETGVRESALNLSVARRVEQLLTEEGFAVVMTRTDENALAVTKDDDMQKRRALLNGDNVDLVVSIHMNAFPDHSVSGAMAYYMAGSAEGQKLAQSVISAICDAIGRSRRLANPGDYFVLRECACPAVLVECGFLSNPDDEKLLTDPGHQEKLAQAIVAGIRAYIG